jgi:L-aspartate oxidase
MSDNVHDVIIIGGGIAGLFCALKLSPRPVTMLTAAPIGAHERSDYPWSDPALPRRTFLMLAEARTIEAEATHTSHVSIRAG